MTNNDLKLLGRAAAIASCGVTIAYSETLLSYGSSLSHTGFVLAGVSLATGVTGAITVAQDILKQVIPHGD